MNKMTNLSKLSTIVLFIGILFASCNDCSKCTNELPTAESLQIEAANKQLADNLEMYTSVWDNIINKGDLELINETNFDKNITLVYSPEDIVGIDAFKDHYNNYIVGFSDVSFTIVDVFGQGDKIVKHWSFKGTHSGDFFGIPATGNEIDIDGVTLVKMIDGKIAQEQDFMDNLEFMQQLGMIPRE